MKQALIISSPIFDRKPPERIQLSHLPSVSDMVLPALLLFSCLFENSWQDTKEASIFSMFSVDRKEGILEFTRIDAYEDIISDGCPDRSYVLFHGFKGSVNHTSNEVLANALFDLGEKSVLVVDYEEAVQDPYTDAVNASVFVSRKVAEFFSTSCSPLRFAGLSLGAQVAGMTARLLSLNYDITVERILGLDPAFPLYSKMEKIHRLDREDAAFVMVVHTAGNELGFLDPMGHADFYPNGGVHPQPHCGSPQKKYQFVNMFAQMICSHVAPLDYLKESTARGGFLATKCTSWADFKNGLCDSWEKVHLALDTPSNVRGMFFLRTHNTPPLGDPEDCYTMEEFEDEAAKSSSMILRGILFIQILTIFQFFFQF